MEIASTAGREIALWLIPEIMKKDVVINSRWEWGQILMLGLERIALERGVGTIERRLPSVHGEQILEKNSPSFSKGSDSAPA